MQHLIQGGSKGGGLGQSAFVRAKKGKRACAGRVGWFVPAGGHPREQAVLPPFLPLTLRKRCLRAFWRMKKGTSGTMAEPDASNAWSTGVARTCFRLSLSRVTAAVYLFMLNKGAEVSEVRADGGTESRPASATACGDVAIDVCAL